jgi:hypothetical protein
MGNFSEKICRNVLFGGLEHEYKRDGCIHFSKVYPNRFLFLVEESSKVRVCGDNTVSSGTVQTWPRYHVVNEYP